MNRKHLAALALGAALLAFAPGAGRAADGKPAVVDLNRATAQELEALPGIGAARAQAIVAERKRRGGFKSVDELVEVKGIGPANLEKLRPFLSTSSRGGSAR
jgi:competence protein ComEA